MRKISILSDVEVILEQLVRAIPDVFLEFDNIELEQVGTALVWDIVHVIDEDEELVIGQVMLNDLVASVEIFE